MIQKLKQKPISLSVVLFIEIFQRKWIDTSKVLTLMPTLTIWLDLENLIMQLENLNCSCVHIAEDLNLDTRTERKCVK